MFKQEINKFIDTKNLFSKKDNILVAISGGADSVALLRVLLDLGYSCEAAHCNFHLRGEESNRDENFVKDLCLKMNVNLNIIHFQTTDYAEQNHISIEMAARELRYNWFERLRKEKKADYIAVAHHRDDSVETFILNLVRGAGINGLKGISAKNGYIVRPLLEVSRKNIIDYLELINQDFVTDSTNLQDEYMRNKIRLNILPQLSQLNPVVSQKIAQTSQILSDVAAIYNDAIEKSKERVLINNREININNLLKEVAPQTLLFEILYPLGFNSSQITDVYSSIDSQSGKRFFSENYEIVRDRDSFIIRLKDEIIDLPKLSIEYVKVDSSFKVLKDKNLCFIDADKISEKLIIRKCQHGDKFVPYGMTGQKKISDYMTDKKYSLFDKVNQCVVCCGNKIVWLVNERSDDRFKITKATKLAAILKIS